MRPAREFDPKLRALLAERLADPASDLETEYDRLRTELVELVLALRLVRARAAEELVDARGQAGHEDPTVDDFTQRWRLIEAAQEELAPAVPGMLVDLTRSDPNELHVVWEFLNAATKRARESDRVHRAVADHIEHLGWLFFEGHPPDPHRIVTHLSEDLEAVHRARCNHDTSRGWKLEELIDELQPVAAGEALSFADVHSISMRSHDTRPIYAEGLVDYLKERYPTTGEDLLAVIALRSKQGWHETIDTHARLMIDELEAHRTSRPAHTLAYRGYVARFARDSSSNTWHGRTNTKTGTGLTFTGASFVALEQAMHIAIDQYLEDCARHGVEP